MKKFWNLVLAALVVFGVAACTEDKDSVNGGNDSTALSFNVEVAGYTTRTDLSYDDESKLWNTVFEGDETIVITYNEKEYKFTNTKEEPKKFTCATSGVKEMIGQAVALKISNDTLSLAGKKGLSVDMAIEKFDPSKGITLQPANSFLHYTYEGDGKLGFEMDYMAFVTSKSSKSGSITVNAVKGENWVSFLPGDKTEAKLKYSVNNVLVKELTLNLAAGVVYNLGTLTAPEGGKEDEGDKEDDGDKEGEATALYFVPGVWNEADAWYAAYFFNSNDENASVKMTDEDGDGIFECEAPANMEKVIFCRMNPTYTEFGWNDDTTTDRVWNQTADLDIPIDSYNYYYITGWSTGAWGSKDNAPAATAPWAVAGSFNEWGNLMMDFTDTDSLFIAKSVTLEAGAQFKIKAADNWDTCFGKAVTLAADHYIEVGIAAGEESNISVATAGIYDIYFEHNASGNSKIYLMTAGGDITTATEQGATSDGGNDDGGNDDGGNDDGGNDDGGNDDGSGDTTTTATTLYLVPGVWDVDNAWFAAYFWNDNGNTNVTMTDEDEDGIFECNVPEGYSNIIFVRLNPAATSFSWDSKWSQTADLTVPGADNNYYYILDWNVGVWGTKDGHEAPETPASNWAVAGTFNSWGDLVMEATTTANLFVAKDVALVANDKFKIKQVGNWVVAFGKGTTLSADRYVIASSEAGEGTDILIATAGTYDIYFEYNEGGDSKIYLMTAGGDITTATEQL